MTRKTKIIFLTVFFIWFAVTIYFYNQHTRVVWTATEMPSWTQLYKQGFQVTEIYIYEWEKKDDYMRYGSTRYKMFQAFRNITNMLPVQARTPFYNTISSIINLYSDPYEELNEWKVVLKGFALKNMFPSKQIQPINLCINEKFVSVPKGESSYSENSNLIFFEIEGRISHFKQHDFHPLKVEKLGLLFRGTENNLRYQEILLKGLNKRIYGIFETP